MIKTNCKQKSKPSKNSMIANEVDSMRFIVVYTGRGIRSTYKNRQRKVIKEANTHFIENTSWII